MAEISTRVLVVEDDPDDEALLMRQFHSAKLDIYIKFIRDGQMALDYLTSPKSEAGKLVAILLDLQIPSLSGLKLLKKVRSNLRLRHLQVIVMTSSNAPQDLDRCKALGVTAYLPKPITLMDFTRVIANGFHPLSPESPSQTRRFE